VVCDALPRPRRVLVVDDDPGMRAFLQLVLKGEGYAVATAASLGEALAALADGPPDLVIGDVRLPGAPAFALLDALRADPTTASIPVVVCSGAVQEIERAGARLARERVAVLLKPFDIDALLAVVDRLAVTAAE
jgi:CheY-like chemotaxis protein